MRRMIFGLELWLVSMVVLTGQVWSLGIIGLRLVRMMGRRSIVVMEVYKNT